MSRLGTFYNATIGSENRQRVEDWARESYPEAYNELLKCGKYERTIRSPLGEDVDDEDEEWAKMLGLKVFFNIDHLGREVKP